MQGVDESVPYPTHYEAHYPKTKALAEQVIARCASWAAGDHPEASSHLGAGRQPSGPAPAGARFALAPRRGRHQQGGYDLIDNAALAHVLAEEKLQKDQTLSGRIYFISQDEPISLWDMINHILAAGGRPAVQKSIPLPWHPCSALFVKGCTCFSASSRNPP